MMLKNILFKIIFVNFVLLNIVCADVIRDGSIGPDSSLQASGPDFVIDESMGKTAGNNLFHSFSKFDLDSNESASFTVVSPINNIISRVTGDSVSQIHGTINSTALGASLFFINPNGVMFGENSAININGSFHVSTGNYLSFDDNTQFSVTLDDTQSILSTATPTAFGFVGNLSAGNISINKSNLVFKEKSQLSLIGGDISIISGDKAVITLPGGQLKIVSVRGNGEVALAMNDNETGNLSYGVVDLQGQDDVVINVLADDIDDAPDPSIDLSSDLGGQIIVNSQDLNIRNFSIANHTRGSIANPNLGINFTINDQMSIQGNAQISSISEGSGKAGDILVNTRTLRMDNDAEILNDTYGSAAGGKLTINADEMSLYGDAEIASDVEGTGNGGAVEIKVKKLIISNEAEISSDTAGTGNGGNILIDASESIFILEQGGVFADTQSQASAGNITISTPTLIIQGVKEDDEEDEMDDDIFESAGIYTISTNKGNAGDITINANIVEVRDEAAIAASAVAANGGNIVVNASERLFVRGSGITANVNQGIGGNIQLSSDLVLVHDADVVAKAGTGQGGNIVITANQFFSSEAQISASAGPAGVSGSVSTPISIDLTNSLAISNTEFIDGDGLFDTECKVRGNIKKTGSFVVLPKKIRPTNQEGLLMPTVVKNDDNLVRYIPQLIDPEILDNKNNFSLVHVLQYSLIARKTPAKAIQYLSKAEKILASVLDSHDKPYALLYLANSYFRLANLYEPHLIKAHELMRQAQKIAKLRNDSRALSFVLGNIALLYAAENRLDEALLLSRQALDMANSDIKAIDARYRWHRLEGQLLWKKGYASPAIAAMQRAVNILSQSRIEALIDQDKTHQFFTAEVEPVYLELVDYLFFSTDLLKDEQQKTPLLLSARAVIEQFKAAELRDYFADPCITELANKTKKLDELANLTQATAIVYPIALPERLEVLVTLPSGLKRFTVPISRETLAVEASRFRASIQKVGSLLYRREAKTLYQWIIEPIDAALKQEKIETLVFVPGAILRSIPMAALFNGEKFLVEQYALAMTPSLRLVDPKPMDKSSKKLLLAGISQKTAGFSALPSVVKELNFIEKLYGKENTTILLDKLFIGEKFSTILDESQPNIVHIASHAGFSGDKKKNFILNFDGKMSIKELQRYIGVTKYRASALELLILSACETANGDDRAALGLAGISIQAGARSAMGSLWKISDAAAAKLISLFYTELIKAENTKATALQKAQLSLIQDQQYKHPYYWSPFLIINNWL